MTARWARVPARVRARWMRESARCEGDDSDDGLESDEDRRLGGRGPYQTLAAS